ncbi:hypothetical protein TNIN_396091 [Trichonephila inaurata madagascariensis]|uniref:Uncharacterized protein n=1 Tax=Trichonephila inaurata madagascariensis TaxID=2747483 RepID=A0A8X7BT90_9ARAC|nr:hypothetical protein TNIN_396091 [Trichonephila inaurata madagascariensis]
MLEGFRATAPSFRSLIGPLMSRGTIQVEKYRFFTPPYLLDGRFPTLQRNVGEASAQQHRPSDPSLDPLNVSGNDTSRKVSFSPPAFYSLDEIAFQNFSSHFGSLTCTTRLRTGSGLRGTSKTLNPLGRKGGVNLVKGRGGDVNSWGGYIKVAPVSGCVSYQMVLSSLFPKKCLNCPWTSGKVGASPTAPSFPTPGPLNVSGGKIQVEKYLFLPPPSTVRWSLSNTSALTLAL